MNRGEILEQLADLVFKQNNIVSCYFVSKHFEIHVSEAAKVLEDFASKNASKLVVDYLFWCVGSNQDSDVPLHRFFVVNQDDFASFKSSHSDFKWRIYSASALKNVNFLNFDKFLYELNAANFEKAQSLTYLRNSQIGIRPPRRGYKDPNLKNGLTNGHKKEEEKSEKPRVKEEKEEKASDEELMEVEVTKNSTSNNNTKRPKVKDDDNENSFNGSNKKKRKRVQIFDSDEEEEEEEKPKKSVAKEESEDNDGFTVTKLTELEDKPKPMADPKKEIHTNSTTNDNKKSSVLKPNSNKKQKQASIMSFFAKKPAAK